MTNAPADDEVIRAVRAGQQRDFEIIVRRYSTRVIAFVQRMTGDADEAQAIAQDVFITIFQTLNYYREKQRFTAFLFTVAKNQTLNWLKKQQRWRFFSQLSQAELKKEPFQVKKGPDEELDRRESAAVMRLGLLSLKKNQRTALLLKICASFSYCQISSITGWSEAKVESLIFRAKKNLRIFLAQEMRD